MVTSVTKLANVVEGKTARACDNCVRKRARWYCAADDAFLCQSCDGLVHAANPLARRHERLRLKIASMKLSSLDMKPAPPPWHQGFTKKPRTPRTGSHHRHASRHATKSEESGMSFYNPLHIVPEIGSDDTTTTVTCEKQLVYQVPVFDLLAAELCLSGNSDEAMKQLEMPPPVDADHHRGPKLAFDLNSLNGLMIPSDVELAEFAADVENLLGKGLNEEAFAMEGLGLPNCSEKDSGENSERVKVEEDDQMQYEMVEMMKEPFELSFDSPLWEEKYAAEGGGYGGGGGYMAVVKEDGTNIGKYEGEKKKKKIVLKLDFEGIIAAWDEERSPWTAGGRPELEPDDCWPQCMGGCGIMHHYHPYGAMGTMTGNPTMLDGGRDARVSRYREKRRTRLFSKKIRYEVRKLNAEKRPRMKGRFVKRTSSLGFPLVSK